MRSDFHFETAHASCGGWCPTFTFNRCPHIWTNAARGNFHQQTSTILYGVALTILCRLPHGNFSSQSVCGSCDLKWGLVKNHKNKNTNKWDGKSTKCLRGNERLELTQFLYLITSSCRVTIIRFLNKVGRRKSWHYILCDLYISMCMSELLSLKFRHICTS